MEEFYIIGAGGFAKEVHWLLKSVHGKRFNFKGYIDRENSLMKDEIIISEKLFFLKKKPNDKIKLFLGIGNPQQAKTVLPKYSKYNFPNAIHPSYKADTSNINIGIGNIITAGVVHTTDITIGDFNIFNLNSTVGHDTEIGSYNVFNPSCNISGGCSIGNGNLFGTNSTVLQYINIKNDSVIGAAALLTKDVSSNKLLVGVPAKIIKNI
ncbi:hypothetical protein MNBD_BACTEROID06-41 [hydrothermal vent metagenome]|uniref:PglD N-terminal domain-containing protein n=1 Tax=hydrothermal vent metagenome TaxID=652676 RepID=A0A3B0UTM5_9ZZZZ